MRILRYLHVLRAIEEIQGLALDVSHVDISSDKALLEEIFTAQLARPNHLGEAEALPTITHAMAMHKLAEAAHRRLDNHTLAHNHTWTEK